MNKSKNISTQNNLDAGIIFQVILVIVIIPVFSFLTVTAFGNIFYEKIHDNDKIFTY